MGATLNALHELHAIELQIIDIRQQLARKEKAVANHEKKLGDFAKSLQAAREQVQTTQRDADRLDLDVKSRSAHINRLREQLNTVRTNKEYAAVLSQLNTERADLTKLENATMEKIEQVDRLKAEFATQEKAQEEEKRRLEDARRQLNQTRQMFADRLAALRVQRDSAAGKLDPGVRTLFERTSERYDGEALARIARTHPRRDEFICDGCNMSVAADRFNALQTRDEVQTCSNCGRILYIEN